LRGKSATQKSVLSVCRALKQRYGMPTLGNPSDPLDDLVFVTLSNKSAPAVSERVFRNLKIAYPTWDSFLTAPPSKLKTLLRPAGLWRKRSRYLQAALRQIYQDFGSFDLRFLKDWETKRAIEYLAELPGVSEKVARCVLMYTLGFRVLPVDVHVHRVATRLGWTKRRRPDQCHAELEGVVPARWRFSFHVAAIAHGRDVCRPRRPKCEACCIQSKCEYHKTISRGKHKNASDRH
jgi:endonuclease-3